MKIQPAQTIAFGRIYYSTNPANLTDAQRDVVQDIKDYLKKNNYIEKLEKLKYDIYFKQPDNDYAMRMSLIKNASRAKNGDLRYKKIIEAGIFIRNTILKFNKDMQGCFTTDRMEERFYKFFRNESINYYKRFKNYL